MYKQNLVQDSSRGPGQRLMQTASGEREREPIAVRKQTETWKELEDLEGVEDFGNASGKGEAWTLVYCVQNMSTELCTECVLRTVLCTPYRVCIIFWKSGSFLVSPIEYVSFTLPGSDTNSVGNSLACRFL